MRALITLLLFLNIPFTANAAELQNLVNHIQNDGIQNPTSQPQQEAKRSKPQKLPSELKFLKLHKNLDQEFPKTLSPKRLTSLLVSENLVEFHDKSYIEAQERCAFVFEGEAHYQKCEKLITLYEHINNELNQDLDDGKKVDSPLEKLAGVSLDGDRATNQLTQSADPNSQLKRESEVTPNRNSVLQKGHTLNVDKDVETLSLTQVSCQVRQRDRIELPKDILKKLVSKLENVLTSEDSSLKNREEAYCVLYSYYHEEDLMEKITMFLYLNMPGEGVKCE